MSIAPSLAFQVYIFLRYLINLTIFIRKLFNTKYMSRFSVKFLSEALAILRRIQSDFIINVHGVSSKLLTILVRF